MLKNLEQWREYLNRRSNDNIEEVKRQFNEACEKYDYFVFLSNKYKDNSEEWSNPYVEWIEQNFPGYTNFMGFNSGSGSIVFMGNNPEIMLALKLKWS